MILEQLWCRTRTESTFASVAPTSTARTITWCVRERRIM